MRLKKLITGFIASIFVVNLAIADTSPSYTIDISDLNAGLQIQTSPSFQVNDAIIGLVEGGETSSASFKLGSGLVYLQTLCGNSIVEFGEACDDGNTTSGDGCSSVCQTEASVCGNGAVEAGEQCDDGNTNSGDGCSSSCTTETGGGGGGGGYGPNGICGNGVLNGQEQCDDGNNISGDGCSALCKVETTFCGDGIVSLGEECDDGNNANGDQCSSSCRIEFEDDADGDGIPNDEDGFDDTDKDGFPNYLDLDSDGDSIPDSVEGTSDPDRDGLTNHRDIDSDGDTIEDFIESTTDTDSDNIFNFLDLDSDDDGLQDSIEGLGDIDSDQIPNYIDPDDSLFGDIEDLRPAADEEDEEVERGPSRTIKIKSRPEKRIGGDQNLALPATVVFYNRTTGKTMLVTQVNMKDIGWSGFNTDRLTDGVYDISFKGISHLTKVARNIRIDSSLVVIDFSFADSQVLVAGDVHQTKDNFVNGLDVSATVENIYSSDVHADLNRDGIVNALDLSIVIGNLYKSGEQF